MKKKELVDRLARSTGVNKKDSEFMLDAMIGVIADALVEDEEIALPRLGKLYVGTVAAHESFIPMTGESVLRPVEKRARFRPAKELRERLNAGAQGAVECRGLTSCGKILK